MDRLQRQLQFLLEADRVKQVVRQNPLADGSRRENDAEHMWHLALAVLVLAEHAAEAVDVVRVLTMVLVHDLVEIDTGDVLVYDEVARAAAVEGERAAAERIFGLLPDDQASAFREAWEEFEAGRTAEARLAAAVDRLQPMLLNHAAGGGAWVEHGVSLDAVTARNAQIAEAAPALGETVRSLLADAAERGMLRPGKAGAPFAPPDEGSP
ncbi:MAG TPA: HD domain-containing protein [Acidimicrobiales bacterium]|nr:HD domain-containing protein [Acidimicrobiales bacterium]